MGKLFDLEITLDYNLSTPYNDILWKCDWVQGFATSFKVTIVNKSEFVFPGAVIRVVLEEHSSLRSSDLIHTFTPIMVPQLEPGDYITSEDYELVRELRYKRGNRIQNRILLTEYGRSFAEYMNYIPSSKGSLHPVSFIRRFWLAILATCTILGGIAALIFILRGCQ